MTGPSVLRYADAPDRRNRIVQAMLAHGVLTPARLAAELAVSERTVRRDLHRLAAEGVVRLTHGSVYLPDSFRAAVDFPHRFRVNAEAKQAIAARAVVEIGAGDTIALDSGTTTWEIARALPEGRDLTVITHSLPAMTALQSRRDLSLIVLGGCYHAGTMSVAGPQTRQDVGRFQIGTLFLSATSFGAGGVYCATPFDAETKQALIEVSRRVVLVADSSKAQTTAPVLVCPLSTVDLLVTDAGLTAAARRALGGLKIAY